mmetsp:Transcript_43559/g.78667  ORF Transcript_43559/g.78667 Transcript_43559/m.78667 type:complete len:83 (+) Transcript_43559:68-316(+)
MCKATPFTAGTSRRNGSTSRRNAGTSQRNGSHPQSHGGFSVELHNNDNNTINNNDNNNNTPSKGRETQRPEARPELGCIECL